MIDWDPKIRLELNKFAYKNSQNDYNSDDKSQLHKGKIANVAYHDVHLFLHLLHSKVDLVICGLFICDFA